MKFQIFYVSCSWNHLIECNTERTADDLFDMLKSRKEVIQVIVLRFFPGGEYKTHVRYDANLVPATCYEPGNPIDPRD